jgi:hypothetical protein
MDKSFRYIQCNQVKGTLKLGVTSREKQEENEKQLMQLEQILGKEISRGIQICCEQKSKTTETRIVRQSSCNDML